MQKKFPAIIGALTIVLIAGIVLFRVHHGELETELDGAPAKLFWLERAWPALAIPAKARESALARLLSERHRLTAAALAAQATGGNPVWQPIGPQPIVDYLGSVLSGHIEAVAVDPRNSNVVYAGASGGGVWKTLDGGTTWAPLTDNQAALDISALSLDPSNPDTVYAATGFYYQTPGLLKSVDGGNSWTSLPIPGTFPGSRRTAPISSLAISPTNRNIVLAAFGYNGNGASFLNGNAGIYRSTDGGQTWAQVLAANSAHKILFDPQRPGVAYATVGFAASPNDPKGVFTSADSGISWTAIGTNSLPNRVSTGYKLQLAISPSASSTLYASASDGATFLGMYKSVDSGQNWIQLSNVPTYCNFCIWSNVIAVHPTNPNIIFVAGNDVVSRSMDGGVTWSSGKANYIHGDHHAMVFSSDGGILFDGNDGGIYKTSDTLVPFVNWSSLNQNLQVTEYYQGISANPQDATNSFGGSQDNGLLRYGGGKQWTAEFFCDCFTTLINPLNPALVFGVALNSPPILKSTDGGKTFSGAGAGLGANLPFMPRVLTMDPKNPSVLYFGGRNIYQSSDAAKSWNSVSPDITGGTGQITSIAVALTNSNTVYAAASPADIGAGGSENTSFHSSSLWFSANALAGSSANWQQRNSGLPNRWISRVIVDPTDANSAYVALSGFNVNIGAATLPGHVFKTANAGISWIDISSNLPDIPLSDIVIDPNVSGTFYVASDIGVFWTQNSGQSWTLLGTGLPGASVTGLLLHKASRTLRATTYGRGAWDLVLGGGLPSQTITFGPLSAVNLGVAPFALNATASSGLTVTFASTTTNICTVAGNTVTIVAVGTCSITAKQAGNANYLAAPAVIQSFAVVFAPPLSTSPVNDAFTGNSIDTTKWNVVINPAGAGSITPTNHGVEMLHSAQGVTPYLGLQSRWKLSGDFDVQVDFTLANWPAQNYHTVALIASDLPAVGVYRNSYAGEGYQMRTADGVVADLGISDSAGKIRLVRIGATISGYYWTGSQFALLASSSTTTDDTGITLNFSAPSTTVPANVSVVLANFRLNAGAAAGAPLIKPGGVAPIYSSSATIEPGSWVWIFGSNLSQTTRSWNSATEIVNGNLPTSLDGVRVSINNKPAYVYYISPGQISVQAPDDPTTGPVSVTVTNSGGTSNSVTVTLGSTGPSFFTYGDQYALGVIPSSTGVYGPGLYDLMGGSGRYSFNTRPAKAGEVVSLYGTGFGATNPPTSAGVVINPPYGQTAPVTVSIGGVSQTANAYVTAAGEWQINVTVPNVPSGDQALSVTVGGLRSPANVFITVQ